MFEAHSARFGAGGNTAGTAKMKAGQHLTPDPSPHPMRRGEPRERLVPNPKARLKEQFHEVCRFKHLALRSEEAYWAWVVRLVKHFDSKLNPRDMSGAQLGEFLT